jgi:UDP-N-acetylglucosamine 2-epimerase (non-hydrolysing)/GDP/UDP-N,N'-diacetylbacillosamine 2-epimerase (hydrolysing)
MRSTLQAINNHPGLRLQIAATGMHLDRRLGYSLDTIRQEGWTVDAVVPWPAASDSAGQTALARATGRAIAGMADAFESLKSDIVLVVGDRVEAFAAASAAHLSGRLVAHVHGGDRALGQVDDALRHAITKLAHIHFPATAESADRIARLGEDPWRIHRVGSPGVDGIKETALSRAELLQHPPLFPLTPHRFALLVLHPADPDDVLENQRAGMVLKAVQQTGFPQIVIIHPNNDPGGRGIIRRWNEIPPNGPRTTDHGPRTTTNRLLPTACRQLPNAPRPLFLALMRDAAVLVGNSSSGIIEAASFNTPVLDIGPRQKGRQHSPNLTHVEYSSPAILRALQTIWNHGRPRRAKGTNVYGGGRAGEKIADRLARLTLNDRLRRKLIAY